MNIKLLAATAVIFLGIVGMGCKKSSNADTNNIYMKATINDTAFNAIGQSLAYASGASSGGMNYLYVYGEESLGDLIQFTFINNTGAGTYTFGGTNVAAYYYPFGLTNAYTQAVNGSVVLTSVTPFVTGTFSFTCANGTIVKTGSFSVMAP